MFLLSFLYSLHYFIVLLLFSLPSFFPLAFYFFFLFLAECFISLSLGRKMMQNGKLGVDLCFYNRMNSFLILLSFLIFGKLLVRLLFCSFVRMKMCFFKILVLMNSIWIILFFFQTLFVFHLFEYLNCLYFFLNSFDLRYLLCVLQD